MAAAGRRGGRGGGEDYKSAAVDQGSVKSEKDIVRMRERGMKQRRVECRSGVYNWLPCRRSMPYHAAMRLAYNSRARHVSWRAQ